MKPLIQLLIPVLFLLNPLQSQFLYVSAGADINVDCSSPCTTLVANYTPAYQTTSYSVTSIPYTPNPYTTGALYPVPTDDKWSPAINLPFYFCFYGQAFNKYVISTNGIISFNLAYANGIAPWLINNSIPTAVTGFPRSMIGLFHDIDPTVGGTVRYGIIGNFPCRKAVISFSGVSQYSCTAQASTFQIVLYELTNVIEIYVFRKPLCSIWNNGRACLGIQNTAGTLATSPTGRNTGAYNINTQEAWRFTPSGAPATSFTWQGSGTNSTSYTHCYLNDSTAIAELRYTCGPVPIVVRDTVNINVISTPIQITQISHN